MDNSHSPERLSGSLSPPAKHQREVNIYKQLLLLCINELGYFTEIIFCREPHLNRTHHFIVPAVIKAQGGFGIKTGFQAQIAPALAQTGGGNGKKFQLVGRGEDGAVRTVVPDSPAYIVGRIIDLEIVGPQQSERDATPEVAGDRHPVFITLVTQQQLLLYTQLQRIEIVDFPKHKRRRRYERIGLFLFLGMFALCKIQLKQQGFTDRLCTAVFIKQAPSVVGEFEAPDIVLPVGDHALLFLLDQRVDALPALIPAFLFCFLGGCRRHHSDGEADAYPFAHAVYLIPLIEWMDATPVNQLLQSIPYI